MESKDFKEFAKEMIDYVADYLDNIRDRRVLPEVEPGYIRPLLPTAAPVVPDRWQEVLTDVEKIIMPGVTHWHSPHFHAFYATANSYPAIVADILSSSIACLGFSWMSSPACTELEVVMLDWLGKMLALPPEFLSCTPGGKGGGVIQATAGDATLVALVSAKAHRIKLEKQKNPSLTDADIAPKLVAYTSDQAHCTVEKAFLVCGVKGRLLEVDEKFRLRGKTLAEAIKKDKEQGLIPFCVVATLGTTSVCSFDLLTEIGPVCKQEEELWLHIDAAYAGSAFVCEEFRYLMDGIEHAESFNFNPHKWMLVNFDCSAMWLKRSELVVDALKIDPVYLQNRHQTDVEFPMPDYRHWQIPQGRRFRSLKLWFVLRLYGTENIQKHIRKQVAQAHEFENYVTEDPRFEIFGEVILGLVCFRLRGSNELNQKLVDRINAGGKTYLVPSLIGDVYYLRFAICSRFTESTDLQSDWNAIKAAAEEVLAEGQ